MLTEGSVPLWPRKRRVGLQNTWLHCRADVGCPWPLCPSRVAGEGSSWCPSVDRGAGGVCSCFPLRLLFGNTSGYGGRTGCNLPETKTRLYDKIFYNFCLDCMAVAACSRSRNTGTEVERRDLTKPLCLNSTLCYLSNLPASTQVGVSKDLSKEYENGHQRPSP